MPADDRFTIREFRGGDEAAVLDLFARSFPHAPRTLEHFRWKYQRNPFGNERISLAFEGDRLVGHYAGYPVPFWRDGETMIAHQIGDTMTDPSIRHVGRGPTSVLGLTAAHFYRTFCEGRVAFNYGFNVANIQRFSLRFLRSDRVESVTYRVLRSVGHASRWRRRLRGMRLEVVREATPDFDELFAATAPRYRFLIRRDAAYVRWRYLEHPDVRYLLLAARRWGRLIGWAAFRPEGERLVWGDGLFENGALLDVFLREAAAGNGAKEIDCWCPPRPEWLDLDLRAIEFETAPDPQDLSLMCVPFVWPDATDRMRRDLHYARGDSDLF
jgi:hypothetical protein